ncbi:hypothetical protein ILYODFUR_006852, partial [Ilyodon furcidens]
QFLLGGAQTKIQHLSSQRRNKALKSGAFTIIRYKKALRSRLLSQINTPRCLYLHGYKLNLLNI